MALRQCRLVVGVGLTLAAAGFAAQAVDPGEGPRTVSGGFYLGALYGPPLVVSLALVVVTALVVLAQSRWPLVVAGMTALVFLVGSALLGRRAMTYRLGHPEQPVGFLSDLAQLVGEALALVFACAGLQQAKRGDR